MKANVINSVIPSKSFFLWQKSLQCQSGMESTYFNIRLMSAANFRPQFNLRLFGYIMDNYLWYLYYIIILYIYIINARRVKIVYIGGWLKALSCGLKHTGFSLVLIFSKSTLNLIELLAACQWFSINSVFSIFSCLVGWKIFCCIFHNCEMYCLGEMPSAYVFQ